MQRQLNIQIVKIIKVFDFYWLFDLFFIYFLIFWWSHNKYFNQWIKKIKLFGCFDFLIDWKFTHASYLNEDPWKTDEDDMVLGHMAIILFPV